MEIAIHQLEEPRLEFAQGLIDTDPKKALSIAGPFGIDRTKPPAEIIVGIIALASEVQHIKKWVERMHLRLLPDEKNIKRYREFPGMEKAFHAKIRVDDRFIRILDRDRYEHIAADSGSTAFNSMLDFFADAIHSLFGDLRPDCILVGFPPEVAELRVSNNRLTFAEQSILERLQSEDEANQLVLFKPTDEEKRVAAELLPQAEELLFRNFHRALKARCMSLQNPVPLQVLTRQTYIEQEKKQSEATRAWNLATALYYKSGRIPWRPAGLTKSTCFLGLSFHHLKRRSGDLVYASVAQAFSAEVEPFTLKGASVRHDQVTVDKRPYLKASQAEELVERVLKKYQILTGETPARIVIHKTSRFEPGELAGFQSSTIKSVASCDLIWLAPTGFRLLRRGMQPPNRGTICSLGENRHYLFTSGYVSRWGEYPGPHIPAPLEIGSPLPTDLVERCREILMLTKMSWNNADAMSRYPVTISFARRVGMIMTELDDESPPNPLFRFYI